MIFCVFDQPFGTYTLFFFSNHDIAFFGKNTKKNALH